MVTVKTGSFESLDFYIAVAFCYNEMDLFWLQAQDLCHRIPCFGTLSSGKIGIAKSPLTPEVELLSRGLSIGLDILHSVSTST